MTRADVRGVDVTGAWWHWHWQEQAEGSLAAVWRQRIQPGEGTDDRIRLLYALLQVQGVRVAVAGRNRVV
jgi:hypothetical protein